MLEVKNLIKYYKSKSGVTVKALDDVSLKFPKTGMIFILGKSGSGKSTLLNVMGGLDNFDSGDILVKGQSTKQFKQSHFDSYRNTYVGFIFQEYNILDNLTVGQNVALAMQLQNRKPTGNEITSILEEVDLGGLGDRKPNELSGGQKQRVAIARALVKNPDIIMGDEPTGALDSNTGIQIFNTLKKLSKDKLVIIVSHDREFSEKYADRIIELKDGKIISDVSNTAKGTKVEEANISFSGNEIVVKKDYQLTTADLKVVNEYLLKIKKDAKITKGSSEKKSNSKIKFVNTNQDAIQTETGGFKLIKSRLPLKRAFQMGASALGHKKVKLGFTIFLSLIAFTMLGTSITLAITSDATIAANALSDSNYYELTVQKYKYSEGKRIFDSPHREGVLPLEEDEAANIKKEMGGDALIEYSFYKQYDSSAYSIPSYQEFTINGINEYRSDSLTKITKFANYKNVSDIGYAWSAEPEKNAEYKSEPNSVVISEYLFETLKKNNVELTKYKNETTTIECKDTTTPAEVIGYQMKMEKSGNVKNLIIAGIFKTGFAWKSTDTTSTSTHSHERANASNNSIDCCIIGAYSGNNFIDWLTNQFFTTTGEYYCKPIAVAKTYDFSSSLKTRMLLNKLSNKTYLKDKETEDAKFYTKYYIANSSVSDIEGSVFSMFTIFRKPFLYIGLVFVLFSGLLFANFIGNSISYQKKEIGILRAIGARGTDVFKTYMSESFIIAMINFVLSTVATVCVLQLALAPQLAKLANGANVLRFNIFTPLIILGVSLLAAFLSTYLPVLITAKKRPVEAIRNK